jgi:prepilin-type N-terminal cleavage/methylation domain-containing protein
MSPNSTRKVADSPPAFTLIEIMVVVAIMGLILTMGVPIVYKIWHQAPMSQAIRDLTDICKTARREAITQGRQVDLVFHPREGRAEVAAGITPKSSPAADLPPGAPLQLPPPPAPQGPSATAFSTPHSAKLSDKILIEMLDINKLRHEFRDDDVARIRFFPNGTCDELTLILVSDRGERREISLEVTTAMPSVESDPMKFR